MKTYHSLHLLDLDESQKKKSSFSRFSRYSLAGFTIILVVGTLAWYSAPLLERLISNLEQKYSVLLNPETFHKHQWLLLPAGFLGGLLASLSPCILALLPLNLSYIGTLETRSKTEALLNASGFVLGVVLVLSLLGLVSSFSGALMVSFKGPINIMVGVLSIFMGFSLLANIQIPFPSFVKSIPIGTGSFVVGIAFALASSPCASPVLFSVLSMAGATGNQFLSSATMASYAVGYTAVLFLGSVLTGFTKQIGRLKSRTKRITQFGSILLILIGGYYLWMGIQWGLS